MAKRDYKNWDKNDLIKEIEQLRNRKKYGLVWEDKPENVVEQCKTELPVLEEVKSKEIITDPDKPMNLLIEGDNYHALSVLNYTHKGKIDVIYIDPPYNTGARDWKYNNDYVDINDRWRHSKWICMMYHRLILAKKLLSPSGFLICAIDEHEIHNIRHLLDDVFGENNKCGTVTVLHNPKGRNLSKFFSPNSEFMLVYAKNITRAKFNSVAIDEEVLASFDKQDSQGRYRLEPFMRIRTSWSRKNKPKNFYPLFVSKDLKNITTESISGYYKVYPKTKDGREWAWKNIPSTFKKLNKNDYFVAKKEKGIIVIYHKYREQQVFKNVWTNKKYQSEFNGTNLLKKMLGGNVFNYPKSLYLLIDILKITSKKNSVILDYFAGSGTTGHAVLELNKEDNGNRKFILCTNNELNGEEKRLREQGLSEEEIQSHGICQAVTYPRIKKVIEGYSDIEGIPANLQYYKTAFVSADLTDTNKTKLTKKATEMLCIKEDTFEKVKSTAKYKIFRNKKKYTGIIYDHLAIDDFKKEIAKINGKFSVYIFSLGDDTFDEEFEDVKNKVKLSPIPEAILRVYRRIFK